MERSDIDAQEEGQTSTEAVQGEQSLIEDDASAADEKVSRSRVDPPSRCPWCNEPLPHKSGCPGPSTE
jgi:hypothetical protein